MFVNLSLSVMRSWFMWACDIFSYNASSLSQKFKLEVNHFCKDLQNIQKQCIFAFERFNLMMKYDGQNGQTSLSRMSQILNTFERVKFERRPQKEACMSLFMRAEWAGQWRKGGRKFTPFHTQIHPLRGNKKIHGKKYCFRFFGKKNSPPLPTQISVLNEGVFPRRSVRVAGL